ncbi:conserved hypothetical protein [Luminiphilus syltensis NOR5-1B]|uniref:Protein nucleotidyltransferase YdiU n=1 Tax=Luminiphilus syltensis NOR5-1B TaxID=565045 RepID=B8KSX7_9GAMM|nr:YdiU family protein [Luminiphilus syltensis]EED35437.1 conserved hypothetical protein [Luminiphilus syltensis NOR5-1B]
MTTTSFRFDNSYAALGSPYSSAQPPTPVAQPDWIAWNAPLAKELGWSGGDVPGDDALSALSGNTLLPGSEPVATVYAGHQFGSYNPQLGDGRAILLGECLTPAGARFDLQLKGAGTTPYSRGGDGRSPIGPVVREYLVSEAMAALGVPTTRALAAIRTGERVYRQTAEYGAVLTRVASSHLRIGTMQYFAVSQRGEGLEALVDYTVQRHYADAMDAASELNPDLSATELLLTVVGQRLAGLVAQWQGLGFIHGVLNTDNMLLCGETVDYGPCAFMDAFSHNQVFSSIDTQGRYAFANQPRIVHWNYTMLAQSLLSLLPGEQDEAVAIAQRLVDSFPAQFDEAYNTVLTAKFGLDHMREGDRELIDGFFAQLQQDQLDFTLSFRWLTEVAAGALDDSLIPEVFVPTAGLNGWLGLWRRRFVANTGGRSTHIEAMQSSNPVTIPRNHLVAGAIAAAENGDDTALLDLEARWKQPFAWRDADLEYIRPPEPEEQVLRTFCGT